MCLVLIVGISGSKGISTRITSSKSIKGYPECEII
jgi:hypothetical protein